MVQGRNLGFQRATVYHLLDRVDRQLHQTNTTRDLEELIVKVIGFQISCKVRILHEHHCLHLRDKVKFMSLNQKV